MPADKPAIHFQQKATCETSGESQLTCTLEQTAEGTPKDSTTIHISPVVP